MIDCCLDTCVLVDLIKGLSRAETAVDQFSQPGISHVVLGELLLGTLKSSQPEAETRKVLAALSGITVIHADPKTSTLYAGTRFALEKLGFPIPQNDMWIAAAAIQVGVPLVTRDEHFRRVPKLILLEPIPKRGRGGKGRASGDDAAIKRTTTGQAL